MLLAAGTRRDVPLDLCPLQRAQLAVEVGEDLPIDIAADRVEAAGPNPAPDRAFGDTEAGRGRSDPGLAGRGSGACRGTVGGPTWRTLAHQLAPAPWATRVLPM